MGQKTNIVNIWHIPLLCVLWDGRSSVTWLSLLSLLLDIDSSSPSLLLPLVSYIFFYLTIPRVHNFSFQKLISVIMYNFLLPNIYGTNLVVSHKLIIWNSAQLVTFVMLSVYTFIISNTTCHIILLSLYMLIISYTACHILLLSVHLLIIISDTVCHIL